MSGLELIDHLSSMGIKVWLDGEILRYRAAKSIITEDIITELSTRKDEIVACLKRSSDTVAPKISRLIEGFEPNPQSVNEPFPLTDIQQAYWIGRSGSFEIGNVSAHTYFEVDSHNIEISRLESAWQKLILRHGMLRAIFHNNGQQQILAEVPHYTIEAADLRKMDSEKRSHCLRSTREQMSHQVLPADQWPLFDIRASRIDDECTRLHVSIDLLIADAWSLRILFREWAQLYDTPKTLLSEVNTSFRDYVIFEQQSKKSREHKRSIEYWTGRLNSLPPAPNLPLSQKAHPPGKTFFFRHHARLSSETWSKIKQNASHRRMTPSIVLCSVFAEVLSRWSKRQHFSINLTLFNRYPIHTDIDDVVGDFTTLALLEVDLRNNYSFEDIAMRLQEQLWNDLEYRHCSGVDVLRQIIRSRKVQGTEPVMPVVFTSLLVREETEQGFDTAWLGDTVYGISQTPQVWIDHQVYEQDAGVVLNWDVVEELFPEGMIRDMFDTYCRRLEQLGQSDHAWHERSSELLLPEGHKELFAAINATDAEIAPRLLHTPFEDQARLHPEHLAVITPERSLTYGELYRYSTGLAHQLRQQGARPNELVAVVMEKGWEQVVAVLGILHSGAAYLPIDASLPAQRRATLLEQGRVTTVITQPWLKHSFEWPEGYRLICIDQDFSDTDITALQPLQAPQDLAYVIFTSGSTGVPKGVMIDHRGALNTITDINQRLGVCQRDRVIALSALNFDLSVYDIFGVLAAGATLVIPQAQGLRDPQHWADIMQQHGVTLWNSVPALMQLFMEYAETHPERAPTQLRHVLLSGDWIPLTLPDGLKRCVPGVHVTSLGGATEASIWSIAYPIDRIDPSWSSIPYGKPLTNQRFHVLNERLDPCPIWVPGQLFIGGVGVAQGYWDDPQKSAESFITHPRSGERLYRTGDMGRYLPSGDIEFLGREDNQVKVQGYRIELGEIESALNQHPEVRSGLVLALGPKHGEKRLVGYVVPQRDTSDLKQELKNYLKTKLPPYMVPATYMILDALPLTANGKIDRDALPDPVDEASAPMDLEVIEDDLTQQLLKIVGEVVGIRNTSIKANFFDLGGNSISAMRLVNRIQDSYGIQLPLAMFFHTPTIELLASAIGEQRLAEEQSCVVKLRDGNEKALYCFHPIGGSVFCYRELALQIPLDLPVYGIQAYGLDEKKSPYTNIESMASHYIKEIERIDRQGPYRLLGWSMGATVAYEVAQQLIRKNREVEILAILDAQAPKANRSDIIEDDYADYSELFLADLAGTLDTPINFSKEMFIKKDKKDRISYMLSCIESSIPHTEIDAAIFDRKRMGHLLEIFEANMQALGAYQASPYPGDIIAFRAISQHNSRCNIDDWALLTKNNQLTVVDIPADHYSLLRSNNAQAIANKLSTHME
jgi:pyochelin synthetase